MNFRLFSAIAVCMVFFALVDCQASIWQGEYFDTRYGGSLYLCVDSSNRLQGTYSEVGLIQGEVNSTHAWGNYYQAGTSDPGRVNDCTEGFFMVQQTTTGFDGSWECGERDLNDDDDGFGWLATRINGNIPSDNNCGKLWQGDDDDDTSIFNVYSLISSTNGNAPLTICDTTDDDSNSEWRGSYEFIQVDDDGVAFLRDGTIQGTDLFLDDLIGTGTWYEDDAAGAYIAFRRVNGDLGTFKWTGLRGNKGYTVIDPFQLGTADQVAQNWVVGRSYSDDDDVNPADCL